MDRMSNCIRFAGPIATTTPANPMTTPKPRFQERRSSVKTIAATTTPKIAVVALKMEVSPVSICNWPQAISEKGIALLSSPMTKKAPQMRGLRGIAMPLSQT